MSTNKMAAGTINIEEFRQMMSSQATDTIPATAPSHSSVEEEDIFLRWTDESVKLLISLYQEHEWKFGDVNYKNKSVWEDVATGMKGEGYSPTWVQCSNKWKQLKKSFVEVEDNKRATGRGKKTCKFYQELGNILGYKPGVNPVATASSSGQMEIRSEASSATSPEGKEDGEEKERARPTHKKRKRSDSGRSRSNGEAILKFMEDYREEKRQREEKQLDVLQQMHREKMAIFSGLLAVLKK